MTLEEKITLLHEVGEEIIADDELRALLTEAESAGTQLIAYDGFEPSGQMHIAQGILRAININKLTRAGFTFKMLVADWHAMANNKLGGDLDKIQTVGRYFIEVWKAAGMDMSKVEFVWASDLVKQDGYWMLVMRIARTNGLRRFIRTAEMMGRAESMDLTLAQLIYPAMQIADIFMLNARVAQLGMDQRKVNMLAREVGPQLGFWKPISMSHHMLMGLGKPPVADDGDATSRAIQLKMSKSIPDSAIFMTDSREDIQRKLAKAWCPEGVTTENPILDYCKHIIFEKQPSLTIERPEKFGGSVSFDTFEALEKAFGAGEIHPMDLKNALIEPLDALIKPVRDHFASSPEARDLLEKVTSYQVTR